MADSVRTKTCQNVCSLIEPTKSDEFHECMLLIGHDGPCMFPCANRHVEDENLDFAMLLNKFAEMQKYPFSLHVEKTTPEQREWWTNFLEALRLITRELGATTAGGPKYRKDAAIAWLRVIFENIPQNEPGIQVLDNFVDNTGSIRRTSEILVACASFLKNS